LLHKLELILNCKEGNHSIENGYGHISAVQKSGMQSCHRHHKKKNNSKSESSMFTHLFGVSGCFLLHLGRKTLVGYLLHNLELILNCKEGNQSIENGYGHASAAQKSGIQSCHRHPKKKQQLKVRIKHVHTSVRHVGVLPIALW
jgi:hypothetical protein